MFPVSNRKAEYHHWILHIQISLGTKFPLKLTILNFWTKFTQKGHFQSKMEKLNITIEFSILELEYIPNFSLKWQFWYFGPNFLEKGISGPKRTRALAHAPIVVTRYVKLFRTGADRCNRILMSLLLLLAETINNDLSDSNGIRTHNHLVRINHLAKLFEC